MSYVLKSSGRPRNTVPTPMKILTGVVVLLLVLNIFFPKALPSFFTMIARPFWTVENGFLNGFTPREELEREYLELSSSMSKANALAQENAEIKASLGRTSASSPLLATVLKRPPFSAYDTFILDVGVKENVAIGDRVYTLGNIPIGTIAEVIGNTSKVRLYSSSGEKFTILIGPQNIEATAVGKGGGHFESSMPRDTKIKVGDSVHIPGLNEGFVATVEGIASEPSEPFLKVLFRQPVNMYELRWVIIDTL